MPAGSASPCARATVRTCGTGIPRNRSPVPYWPSAVLKKQVRTVRFSSLANAFSSSKICLVSCFMSNLPDACPAKIAKRFGMSQRKPQKMRCLEASSARIALTVRSLRERGLPLMEILSTSPGFAAPFWPGCRAFGAKLSSGRSRAVIWTARKTPLRVPEDSFWSTGRGLGLVC